MPRRSTSKQSRRKSQASSSTPSVQTKLPLNHQAFPQAGQAFTSPPEPSLIQSSSVARKSSYRKKYTDTESWVDRNLGELIEIFNLNLLDLTEDEAKFIVIKLVDMLRGEAATIDKDTIRRRFIRNMQQIHQVIAQSILELRDELTLNQLEFVVNNIGEAVLGYAHRLYKEVLKYNKLELLEILRTLWRTYWIQKKYQMLPVECPRCKFNSLMPDLSCIICEASVSEEELKKYLRFRELLQDFVKQYSEEDVKKTIMYGYIYLNSLGLKPPTHEKDKLDIEILLNSREKDYLKSLLSNKGA